MATATGVRAGIGFRPILEFEGVYDIWPRGNRPEAIRRAGDAFKRRFKAQGEVLGVKSVDIATAPYLAQFAFHGAAKTPNPYLSMVNRMVVVQYEDFSGARRTLVWEPKEPDGSAAAPFYAQMLDARSAIPSLRRWRSSITSSTPSRKMPSPARASELTTSISSASTTSMSRTPA